MNNRFLKIADASKERPATARRHVVTVLTREILDNPATKDFPIPSEHELCRQFGISRVTVRLALNDLENRGLIYRRHGKGTFAHGRSTRIHRHIGVLMKLPLTTENRPLAEILRGMQAVMIPLRASVILIGMSPEEWLPELANLLAGVVVMADGATADDLRSLENRGLPFFIVGKTDLPGPRIHFDQQQESTFDDPTTAGIGTHFFTAGRHVAEALTRAFQIEEPMVDLVFQASPDHVQPFASIPNSIHNHTQKKHESYPPSSLVTP